MSFDIPRFEKGSSAIEVAMIILEAVTSEEPKTRYLIGQDAIKMMEKRKDTTDEEFDRLVMDSVLGRIPTNVFAINAFRIWLAQADLLVRYQKFRIAGLRLPLARMKNTEFIDDALTILPTLTP